METKQRNLNVTPGGAAVFLKAAQGLNHSVYIKYLSVLTRCRINCLLMNRTPSNRMHSSRQLTFCFGKASSHSQHPWGPGVVYLSKKPGTTRHLKLIKYSPETGQVFGFCQRDQNLSSQYANTKVVCFYLLDHEDKCILLFQEDHLRPCISFDFTQKLQRGTKGVQKLDPFCELAGSRPCANVVRH